MKLKIIDNPPDTTCACNSWLKHWERFSNWKPGICPERYCKAYATIGTHVQKTDITDTLPYIIPLCNEHHNMKGREIEVIDFIKIVPADVTETCGKKGEKGEGKVRI